VVLDTQDLATAPLGSELLADAVSQRRGGVFGRQRPDGRPHQQRLRVATLTLQPVKVARQVEGVLVSATDVCDHATLPHADGVVVPTVDGADEAAAVRRGAVVAGRGTGDRAFV
jgi:hypothetical protein